MKKILLLLLCALFALNSMAQFKMLKKGASTKSDSIDNVKMIVSYDMTWIVDTLKSPLKPKSEVMWLEIGNKVSKFYSKAKAEQEALIAEQIMKGGMISLTNHVNIYASLFRDYPTSGKYWNMDDCGTSTLAYEEDVEFPTWEINGDSVKTILDYSCRMATARFRGRTWKAWYAEDIPTDEGPWKLKGLPGLVLRASSVDGHYSFEVTGMEMDKSGRVITCDNNDVEKVSRKEFYKTRRRYKQDPMSFLSNDKSIKIIASEGAKRKARAYNPIEE